jgi:hypothetical protein
MTRLILLLVGLLLVGCNQVQCRVLEHAYGQAPTTAAVAAEETRTCTTETDAKQRTATRL